MPERPDTAAGVRKAPRGATNFDTSVEGLKALKAAGLVTHRSEGTRRVYYIDPHGLGELRRWLDGFWTDALESFKSEIAATNAAQGRKKP